MLKCLGRPKKTESRDTRQAILSAALDQFSRQGYAATSMRQIARSVGVRESALYVHFKGKTEILETLFDVYGPGPAELRLRKSDLQHFLSNPKEFLRDFLRSELERWELPEERKFMRIVVMENLCGTSESGAGVGQDRMLRPRKALLEMFELLIQKKCLKNLSSEFLIFEIMGPMLLLRHEQVLMGNQPVDTKKVQEFLNNHLEFVFSRLSFD